MFARTQLIQSRVLWSCTFFVLAFLTVAIARPSFAFDESGRRLRPFGVSEGKDDKTALSLGVVCTLLSVVSFYMFAIIDMLMQTR